MPTVVVTGSTEPLIITEGGKKRKQWKQCTCEAPTLVLTKVTNITEVVEGKKEKGNHLNKG